MGWLLLACFGYSSKKRKRLRPTRHVHSVDNADNGSYELLQGSPESHVVLGSASEKHDPNPTTRSNLKIRRRSSTCGNQERVVASTRKKVRFDLNVVKYEPIPAHYDEDDVEDETGRTELEEDDDDYDDILSDGEEGSLEDFPLRLSGSRIVRSNQGSYRYRYSNCYDEDDDEQDEIRFEADDDLDQEEDDEICIFDSRGEYDEEVCSSNDLLPFTAFYHKKDTSAIKESGLVVREGDRSQSLYDVMKNPVLIPIENIHQWKTIKAKKFQILV